MKLRKITAAALVLIMCIGLCSCSNEKMQTFSPNESGQDVFSAVLITENADTAPKREDFARAVWISYLDLSHIIRSDEQDFMLELETVIDNLKSINTTDVFLHVRAFGESLCESGAWRNAAALYGSFSQEIDYCSSFIAVAHENDIRVHAWVNPLRISASEDYAETRQALLAVDDGALLEFEDNVILNPASAAVRKLIAEEAAALCSLGFDGVHFDDYFYLNDSLASDQAQYLAYSQSGGDMSHEDYRRNAVTSLIREVYSAVKGVSADKRFGVSPDASIERCRSQHFADVQLWCASDGCVDYICPQIYYGYKNETRPFTQVLEEWSAACKSCELWVGLSFYKVGAQDAYAGSGSGEWLESFDIISRQYAELCSNSRCKGAALYRYDSMFEPASETAAYAGLELRELRKATSDAQA